MRRTPMSRGTGFRRAEYTRPPRVPATKGRRVHNGPVALVAAPKTVEYRDRRLLDLARGMPCLLRIAGTCNRDAATSVAAHSNCHAHGKAGARKADDCYSCWACSACHTWLDASGAARAQKDTAFMRAHLDQVLQWRAIAADPRRPDPDRAACRRALEHLNATPVAFLEPLK